MTTYGGSFARRHAARRQQQAFADAARKAQRQRAIIRDAIVERGDSLSAEGLALLDGMANAFRGIEGAVRGQGR